MTFRFQKRWCDVCKQMQPADHKHPTVEVRETQTAVTHPNPTALTPKAYPAETRMTTTRVVDTAGVMGTCNHCGAKVENFCPSHPYETLNSVKSRRSWE